MTTTEILKQLSKSVELENIAKKCYQEFSPTLDSDIDLPIEIQKEFIRKHFVWIQFYNDLCDYIHYNNIPIDIESSNNELNNFAREYMDHFETDCK